MAGPTPEPREGAARSILTLVAVALLMVAAITAIGFMGYRFYLDELYPAPPPPEPAAGIEAPLEARAERVVIVVIDALREDIANAPEFTPQLNRIAREGQRGTAITQPVTMTLLSVLNLGTGRTPGLSWSVQNFEADVFPDESLFYWAHARGLPVSFNGDAAWSQLFGPYATHAVTFHDDGFYAEFDGELTKKDRASIAAASSVLAQSSSEFPLVVLHLTSTDKVSHKQGALMRDPDSGAPTHYATTVRATDAVIGELYDAFRRPGDLWLITSDHGATDTGNHGGGEDVTRRAPFVLVGAGVAAPDGVNHEISLNSWAATLSLALGLPVPRTAEEPAAYALLDLDADERQRAHDAHLERRREFVAGVAENLGATEDDLAVASAMASPALDGADELAPSDPIIATNGIIERLREHRRWMYTAALMLGVLLQLAVVFLVLRRANRRGAAAEAHPPRRATLLATGSLWLVLMTVSLVFDHWLYRLVDHLGRAFDSSWGFARASLTLLTVTLVGVLLVRLLARLRGPRAETVRTSAIWLAFALSVVATSQIVVKWPFGPLRETFLVLFTWIVGWGGYVAVRRGLLSRRHWAIGGAGMLTLLGLVAWLPDANLQLVEESTLTLGLGLGALALAASALVVPMLHASESRIARGLALTFIALVLGAALAYRLVGEPWVAKLALTALAAALCVLLLPWFGRSSRRDGVFVLALGLAHVMASDQVLLCTVALLGIVYAIAGLRLPEGTVWGPALLAALVGVVDIGFFYILGYRFSFTEMDTRVVFMLDRTKIDLTASFLLMILQHSATWLMLWAAVVANRLERDDVGGLRTAFVAVMAVFVIRTWGTFFGMEFYLLNHWYVSHAVPMFVMEMAAAAVATLWFGVVGLVLRDGWSSGLSLLPPAARGRDAAAALSAR